VSDEPKPAAKLIRLKAMRDRTGWRVQFQLYVDGQMAWTFDGYARFTTEEMCHEHGHYMYHVLNNVIGLEHIMPPIPEPGRLN
jgi:hypothetical protein